VRARFRDYTTTGRLVTPWAEDPEAAARHAQMKAQAQDGTSEWYAIDCTVEGISPASPNVESAVMTKKVIPNPPPPGNDGWNPDPGFPTDLKKWVDDSGLGKCWTTKDADGDGVPDDSDGDGLPDPINCLYRDDSWWGWGQPGFDCDDFADAMYAWLMNHLAPLYPDITIEIVWINGTGAGHALIRVCYGGLCYYIEPQTGAILVCHVDCSAAFVVGKLLGHNINYAPGSTSWEIGKPNCRPNSEPAPWHADPDRKQEIKDKLAPNEIEDYIWPGPGSPSEWCASLLF
jgi:hypothetical protein